MLFATLSLGLALLPFAVGQQVHDIQVGSANGTLAFTPEAIVCIFFLVLFFRVSWDMPQNYRAPNLVIKSCSTCAYVQWNRWDDRWRISHIATPKITLSLKVPSLVPVVWKMAALTLDLCLWSPMRLVFQSVSVVIPSTLTYDLLWQIIRPTQLLWMTHNLSGFIVHRPQILLLAIVEQEWYSRWTVVLTVINLMRYLW